MTDEPHTPVPVWVRPDVRGHDPALTVHRRRAVVAARVIAILVVTVILERLLWYGAVVLGVPLVPPRDDQAAREAVVQAIQQGVFTESMAGDGLTPIVRLPPGWADLSSGGYVFVFQEQRLVVAFFAHNGIGRFDGWMYAASGSRTTSTPLAGSSWRTPSRLTGSTSTPTDRASPGARDRRG